MRQFGAFEAKTHFSEILSNVIKGHKYIITKHGEQVAMIIPYCQNEDEIDSISDIIRAIKSGRKKNKLGKGLHIKTMIEEGRE